MSLVRIAALLAGALPALAFLAAAGLRRLNFDESLALRAGWLLAEGVPAEPPLYMPMVRALGALAQRVEDPGRLLPGLRLAVAASVLLGLVWMVRRARLGAAGGAAAVGLCLLQAAFAAHGYELRYDAAILLGWIAAFGLIQERSLPTLAALGVCAAWLASHHLKGAFFAAGLYAFVCLVVSLERRERRGRLLAFHLGGLGAAAAWGLVTLALGHGEALVGLYTGFAELAAEQEERVGPWTALGAAWARDAVWWLLAAAAVVAAGVRVARRARRGPAALARDPDLAVLAFAGVPLLFLLVHPHPWPYMLAPPAPFLALLVVRAAAALREAPAWGRGALAAGVAAAVLAYGGLAGIWPGAPYAAALRAPLDRQVATLRLLRERSAPDERVIDPSGLAYFRPPCTPEWYIDTLFRPAARRGAWMEALGAQPVERCPWAVNTYRLGMLPEALRRSIARERALATGGLALARGDARHAALRDRLPYDELRSFWW